MAGRPKKSVVATNEMDSESSLDITKNPEDITFDYDSMAQNFDKVLADITTRIKNAETKLTSLAAKEEILNKMIHTTNAKMESTPEENYKLIGTYQNILMKQLESLNLWQESIMKYEDLIQRYIKMKLDIENHKLSNFAKVKGLYKANQELDEGFDALLKNMHNLSVNPGNVLNLQEEAQKQLRLSGY